MKANKYITTISAIIFTLGADVRAGAGPSGGGMGIDPATGLPIGGLPGGGMGIDPTTGLPVGMGRPPGLVPFSFSFPGLGGSGGAGKKFGPVFRMVSPSRNRGYRITSRPTVYNIDPTTGLPVASGSQSSGMAARRIFFNRRAGSTPTRSARLGSVRGSSGSKLTHSNRLFIRGQRTSGQRVLCKGVVFCS